MRDVTLDRLQKLGPALRYHLEGLPKDDLDHLMRALNMSGRGPRQQHIARILHLLSYRKPGATP